jgi:hypothetical protein
VSEAKWLLLVHQIPPKPSYFRVKIWRRLQKLGSVAIKNSVYILPATNESREDFQWILREIVAAGGEATVCEARFIEGLTDRQIEQMFRSARQADYEGIAAEAKKLRSIGPGRSQASAAKLAETSLELVRLNRRLQEVEEIDFFSSPARDKAKSILTKLNARLREAQNLSPVHKRPPRRPSYQGLTWVTRKDIHVDRIASAWLVRRFIDDGARFKFVPPKAYQPKTDEVCFDMSEAEFTHDGDLCTFEVLVRQFRPRHMALKEIAQLIHDIDLKDGKFSRPEAAGLGSLLRGITLAHRADEERLLRGFALLDDLYAHFAKKGP